MQTTSWKAAAATVAITPTEPMWLAGWAARREPASGQAGELFCKALALEDAQGTRVVMVTMDLIAVPHDFAEGVATQVLQKWNLPRERLLFNSSHTHTGPEIRPDKVPFFEIPAEFAAKIAPYRAWLEEQVVGAIDNALKQLKPAALNIAHAAADFAKNRRAESGATDHDIPILQVTDTDGKPIAILFGYACHNLTLPPSVCLYHGDYAGVAQRELSADFSGATAMFFAGPGADQDPFPRGTMELAEQHGRALAENIKRALSGTKLTVNGPLRVAFGQASLNFVALPSAEALKTAVGSNDVPRRRKAEYLLATLKDKRPLPGSYACPAQVLRFGDELLFIALGGEPVVEYARKLKAKFAGPMVWVAGYSNDMFGYVPTRRIASEGGYEGERAWYWSTLPGPFTEEAEDEVLRTVDALVQQVMQ